MRTYRLFIASSIDEFRRQRVEINAWHDRINRRLICHGVYLKLAICEYMSKALAPVRKQDEYNAAIRESDFFVVIVGRRIGSYTFEEFETAYQQFMDSGHPAIAAILCSADQETDDPEDRASLDRFLKMARQRDIRCLKASDPAELVNLIYKPILDDILFTGQPAPAGEYAIADPSDQLTALEL